MRQNCLRETTMNPGTYVEEARLWADTLIARETRGPGDTANALRRVARRAGVSQAALFALRYRNPKRIWADVHGALRRAYLAECERQMRKLEHEITIARGAGVDDADLRALEALVAAHHRAKAQKHEEEQ